MLVSVSCYFLFIYDMYHWQLSSLHIHPFSRRIENRHFKARFILLQLRFGFDEDQKVALVFEGNMHRIRTFRSPEDMEDQVVNFYDNMDPLFTFVDRKHADYRKLEQAVQRVLELVHQAVGSPASSVDQESLFKREVSPDLDVNAGLAVAQHASYTFGIQAELKIGMKVPVQNMLRWVKLPSGGKTESIKWWPGVLYESCTELIQDVGECSV